MKALKPSFSTPLSIDYNSFQELIEELLEKNDYKTAMLMKQNYGLLMSFEPEETVQCHHFNIDIWQENFRSEMFSIYPERKI
ncbi:hypothetical protein [uncultured Cyclobacterium sp.]|uniref:hypothetical protein n=1 Tax=uncultured Cyclobacterium sp. TaxID=453820 RepID=UPI0030EE4276